MLVPMAAQNEVALFLAPVNTEIASSNPVVVEEYVSLFSPVTHILRLSVI